MQMHPNGLVQAVKLTPEEAAPQIHPQTDSSIPRLTPSYEHPPLLR